MLANDDALIEAAVGDVSDLELRFAARRELGECITAADENTVNRAIARFAKVKRSTRPDLWRWILLAVILIFSLLIGTFHARSGVVYYKQLTGNDWEDYQEPATTARKNLGPQSWTRQQEPFLFGEWGECEMPLDERLHYHSLLAISIHHKKTAVITTAAFMKYLLQGRISSGACA